MDAKHLTLPCWLKKALRVKHLALRLPLRRDSLSNKFIVNLPPLVLYLTFRLGIIFIFIE
jgi:hypothetical protein